jgi:uncharacterized protein YqeY
VTNAIEAQLREDINEAVRARDSVTAGALRMGLAALQNAEVAGKSKIELDDAAAMGVLAAEVKKRNESIEIYAAAGRDDLVQQETAERTVLERYLPAAISDDELHTIVASVVADTGAAGMKAMGAVIGAVRARVGAGADGARISAAVKAALADPT